jgi:hypothetical protein
MGEGNGVITTMEGDNVLMKGIAVGWPSGNGGATRTATIHTTQYPVTEAYGDKQNCWHA